MLKSDSRLGRLAIDKRFQRQGQGAALITDAVTRARRPEIAMAFNVFDAKDNVAAAFYRRYGFEPYPANLLRLYASLDALKSTFAI